MHPRIEELVQLDLLLREVQTINSGSGCLERIALCIELAKNLTATDLKTARPSFMQFLIPIVHAAVEGDDPLAKRPEHG
jgi:hypothetical protein